jgi:hypothetical protein
MAYNKFNKFNKFNLFCGNLLTLSMELAQFCQMALKYLKELLPVATPEDGHLATAARTSYPRYNLLDSGLCLMKSCHLNT